MYEERRYQRWLQHRSIVNTRTRQQEKERDDQQQDCLTLRVRNVMMRGGKLFYDQLNVRLFVFLCVLYARLKLDDLLLIFSYRC